MAWASWVSSVLVGALTHRNRAEPSGQSTDTPSRNSMWAGQAAFEDMFDALDALPICAPDQPASPPAENTDGTHHPNVANDADAQIAEEHEHEHDVVEEQHSCAQQLKRRVRLCDALPRRVRPKQQPSCCGDASEAE